MRISTVCDTNVDIVQLPLNWFLVNARKAAFFRNMYFFCSLLICLRNIIHIGFFPFFFITFSSLLFTFAWPFAFLPITLEILIFECFLKVLRITPASSIFEYTVAMPLVSIFPDFIHPFIQSIRCIRRFFLHTCTHKEAIVLQNLFRLVLNHHKTTHALCVWYKMVCKRSIRS